MKSKMTWLPLVVISQKVIAMLLNTKSTTKAPKQFRKIHWERSCNSGFIDQETNFIFEETELVNVLEML